MLQTKQVPISIPKGWNALTTPQLEAVSRILINAAKHYTATGEYDQRSLLVECFFAVSDLRIISFVHSDDDDRIITPSSEEEIDPAHTYFECEFRDEGKRNKYQYRDGVIIPIRVYIDEIVAMSIGGITQQEIDRYLARLDKYHNGIAAGRNPTEPEFPKPQGPLSWVVSHSDLVMFPYPDLTLPDKRADKRKEKWINPDTLQVEVRQAPSEVTFQGPAQFMQDFTWRQYRLCNDFRSYLAKCENALIDMQRKKMPPRRLEQQSQIIREVRSEFLATLFSRKIVYTDETTQQLVYDYHFVPSQPTDNAYLFIDIPEEKFQAIDLWWQGMMLYLQSKFPKVFRQEAVGKSSGNDDAFVLYTRSTTTMIKYSATNESEVNNTTYTIILEHINDMAEENERIEKMKKS